MKLGATALKAFKKHVLQEYPREAVGVIVNDAYIPCQNVALEPRETFRVSPQEALSIETSRGPIQALLHSHPYNPAKPPVWPAQWPTSHDMEDWLNDDIPFGIVATDGEGISDMVWLDEREVAPLKGREFIHGIHDCYSLIRDWFKVERNVTLPNYARSMEWWNEKRDLYRENFAAAGFVEIEPREVKVGDCALFKVASPVINHAAVVTGPNTILHHKIHRASGEDDLHRWKRLVVKYVRYVPPAEEATQ